MRDLEEVKTLLIQKISSLNEQIVDMEMRAEEIKLSKEGLSQQSVYAATLARREAFKETLAMLMKLKRS